MSAWSPEIRVMLHPAAAYRCLSETRAGIGRWRALRRPLFFAFLLGCMVSLIASQRLTLRLVAGGAINASFILLAQIAALALVCRRERTRTFSQSMDLFFAGYGPWSLWIIVFSAVWAFASQLEAFALAGARTILLTTALAAVWSAYIDFCFFARVLHRSPAGAARDVLLHRALSWSAALVIFGGGPVLSECKKLVG